MKLHQRLARIEQQIGSRAGLKPHRHLLESIMRFFLIHRHLAVAVKLGHKKREEMSQEEWATFCAISVECFNAHKRQYREDGILGYIGVTSEMLPELINAFLTLPDRADYEH